MKESSIFTLGNYDSDSDSPLSSNEDIDGDSEFTNVELNSSSDEEVVAFDIRNFTRARSKSNS